MNWQDLVFFIGQIVMGVSMIPSLVTQHKPHIKTSILSGSILAVYSIVFYTLDLPKSTIGCAFVACLWFILAVQRHKINRSG